MYRRLLFGRLWRPVARTASFGVLIALFLVCGALYAETTTVKLSPLVAKSTLLGAVDGSREIGVTSPCHYPIREGWLNLSGTFPPREIRCFVII